MSAYVILPKSDRLAWARFHMGIWARLKTKLETGCLRTNCCTAYWRRLLLFCGLPIAGNAHEPPSKGAQLGPNPGNCSPLPALSGALTCCTSGGRCCSRARLTKLARPAGLFFVCFFNFFTPNSDHLVLPEAEVFESAWAKLRPDTHLPAALSGHCFEVQFSGHSELPGSGGGSSWREAAWPRAATLWLELECG